MSLSSIPRSLREYVNTRDAGCCRYCGLSQVGQAAVFHVDHVQPRSRGGATVRENLALQCPYCSLHKSDRVDAIDPASAAAVPLFHPLRDDWEDHFILTVDGVCRGRTPTGRATVAALAMNDALPRIARAMQIAMGLLSVTTSEPPGS